jgi:predicted alpha/beta superfamily hydrolase
MLLAFLSLNSKSQSDHEDITFGNYRIIHSKTLDEERMLYIKLPENYEPSDDSYPVVFQLYSHFLYNYYLPVVRTANLMAETGEAPEMIVVGIKNQEFRYRDLLPEDHWRGKSEIDNFLKFFEDELIPFIDSNYRTQNFRILSGPQAGAAFGIYAMSLKPDLFNALFLSDPFWIESSRETLLERFSEAVNQNDYTNKFLMITYEGYSDTGNFLAFKRLDQTIHSMDNPDFRFIMNKIPSDFDYSVSVDFDTGMKNLFAGYKFPREGEAKELGIIEDYYKNLSDRLGFEIKIPQFALVFEGDIFFREEEYEKALDIFHKMHELYPEGLMCYDRLGSVYYKLGQHDLAIKYYQMFLEIEPGNPRIKSIIKEIETESGN